MKPFQIPFAFVFAAAVAVAPAADLRIGIIGLDTSHVTAFTQLLNDPSDKNHVPGGQSRSGVQRRQRGH